MTTPRKATHGQSAEWSQSGASHRAPQCSQSRQHIQPDLPANRISYLLKLGRLGRAQRSRIALSTFGSTVSLSFSCERSGPDPNQQRANLSPRYSPTSSTAGRVRIRTQPDGFLRAPLGSCWWQSADCVSIATNIKQSRTDLPNFYAVAKHRRCARP